MGKRTGLGIVLWLLFAPACAHFRVAPADVGSATVDERRRVNVIAWGALEPRVAPVNCQGNGLASVTVRVSALGALATIVTVGFWTPAVVEWTCAKDHIGGR